MAELASAEGIVELAAMVQNLMDRTRDNTSLVQKTRLIRVEPSCLVDSSLRGNEAMTDIANTLLAMFSGFYVQAVSIGLDGYAVKAAKQLEPYGTNPVNYENKIKGKVFGVEGYNSLTQDTHKPKYNGTKLYNINPFTKEKLQPKVVSNEDDDNDSEDEGKAGFIVNQTGQDKLDQLVKEIKDQGNFSVGKIVNILVKETDGLAKDGRVIVNEVTIPVGIRLFTSMVNPNPLTDILASGTAKLSAVERKVEYKMGKLSFWKDIILCRDMYTQFRKNLMVDKTGYVKANLDRQSSSLLARLVDGKRNAAISALMVLSKSTARILEEKTYFKLDNYRERNKLFAQTGTMIMAVVDEDYRMVKFYFHSIERDMEVSYTDLKKASGDKLDVNSIMMALSMGNAPRL